MSRPPERRIRAMYSMYTEGATLAAVGARFHVSRQRVLQVFQEHDLPTRSAAETRAVKRAKVLNERRAEVEAACAELRDVDAVARKLKLPKTLIRKIAREHVPATVFRRDDRQPGPPLYSDAQLIAILKKADSAIPEQLTQARYMAYAKGRRLRGGRPWPSSQTIGKRFGTWRNALTQAGIDQ